MNSFVEKRREEFRFAAGAVRSLLLPILLLAAAAVTVPKVAAQAQPNNNFSNAIVIVGASGTIMGNNIGATRETNEPLHYAASPLSARSVWFRWTAPETGVVTFDTTGSTFDPILAAYILTGTNGLVDLRQLASDDDSGSPYPGTEALVRFPVLAGTNYYIAVDGYRAVVLNDQGQFTLRWNMGVTNPPISVPVGVFQFSQPNYFAFEDSFFATITVWYGGNPDGLEASVDYYATNLTAIDGIDFVATNGTLVFAPGEQIKTFTVQILDNFTLNNNRTVLLALANPTNGFIFPFFGDTAVLTIVDDEAPFFSTAGRFTFSSSTYVGTENESLSGP